MRLSKDAWVMVLGVGAFGMIGTWLRVLVFELFAVLKIGGSEAYAHIIATFTVNVLGAFGIGLISVISETRRRPQLMLWWGTGMMGGFTTFSTMMRDMYVLLTTAGHVDGHVLKLSHASSMFFNTGVTGIYERLMPFVLYLLLTMLFGLLCVWLGRWGARRWMH